MAENYFDERIAATYEAKWPELFEPAVVDPAVSFLADLALSGTALELGIGTGRLALPLSQRGIRVHGIELSSAMVAHLPAKPGADGIGVTIGDFATAKVSETFGLAYLVRNTIMNLTAQDTQADCFGNVARHLEPGGCFVIEVIVPDLQRLPPGETVRAFATGSASPSPATAGTTSRYGRNAIAGPPRGRAQVYSVRIPADALRAPAPGTGRCGAECVS